MEADEKYSINGLIFDDENEYNQACKEWDTICSLEKKLPLGDPKAALQLYNQAVAKKTFKTFIGYTFLKGLRDTVVKNGVVNEDVLNPIPIIARKPLARTGDTSIDRLAGKYEKEKKKRVIMTIVIIALVTVIVGMFAITLSSKYSFITYFTNYEDNIRNEVINDYEEWESELDARESELDAREAELNN